MDRSEHESTIRSCNSEFKMFWRMAGLSTASPVSAHDFLYSKNNSCVVYWIVCFAYWIQFCWHAVSWTLDFILTSDLRFSDCCEICCFEMGYSGDCSGVLLISYIVGQCDVEKLLY